jgi:hypothetical protein
MLTYHDKSTGFATLVVRAQPVQRTGGSEKFLVCGDKREIIN